MNVADSLPAKASTLRRSQRVCLSVPVSVVREGLGTHQVSEETRTLIVSAHGALILLGLPVEAGQLLTMRHTKTLEELICRVVHVGPDQAGKREIGVEFEKPAPRFWRIAFPPLDWSPRSVDAKPPTAHPILPRPLLKKTPPAAANVEKKTPADKASGPPAR